MDVKAVFLSLLTAVILAIIPFSEAWCKAKKDNRQKSQTAHPSLPPISHIPLMPVPEWMSRQIQKDFSYFKEKEISLQEINDFFDHSQPSWFMAKFSIHEHQLSIEKKFPNSFVDVRLNGYVKAIHHICQNLHIPDCVFLISLADACSLPTDIIGHVPVLAFAKPQEEQAILIPDFEVFLNGSNLIQQVNAAVHTAPWETKKRQAVWRGTTTGGGIFDANTFLQMPRSLAVATSLEYPVWVDARYTQIAHCAQPHHILKTFSSFFGASMSIAEQIQYRYQLLIDGNSCAYSRAYWQLFSNCLILKQESSHIQWYYESLRPYEHYLPLKADLSDLIQMLEWADTHEEESRAIMERASSFALNNLQLPHVYQYLFLVLMEYSQHYHDRRPL